MRKNIVSCDSGTARIYLHSANTSTIINSFSSPSTNPQGLVFNGKDIINLDGSGRVYHLSGFSGTVLNSFSTPGTAAKGLTFDNRNLVSCDSGTDRIYKYSSVSATVINSFSSISTSPQGLAFDGQNLFHSDSNTDRIYLLSGFSSTVLTSFSSPSTTPTGLVFDGLNLIHIDSNTDRLYKFSGISSTITNSYSTISTTPTGLTFETTVSSSDCIELNNGDILTVYNNNQGGANYDCVSKRYDTSAKAWQSEVSVDANNTGYTHPAVVQLASNASIPNRLILAFRDKAAGTINIFKSDDNAASWSSLTTVTSDLDEENRISLVRSGTSLVLSYHRSRVCYSRKSTDNGTSWGSENTISTSAVHADLSVLDTGAYVAVYEKYDDQGNNYGKIYSVSSVNGTTWTLASSQVMTSSSVEYKNPSVVVDEAGTIVVFAHDALTKDLKVVRSSSKTAEAWGTVQNANPLPNQGNRITATTNLGYFNPSSCRALGEIFTLFESFDGTSGHLTALKTNTWRNVTEATGYTDVYYPLLGLPDVITSFILTNSAGTATESDGILTLTTTSSVDSRLYMRKINNVRTTNGLKVRFKTEIDSGAGLTTENSIFKAKISDGSNDITTTLRFSVSGFAVMDGNRTDAWGALSWSTRTWEEFSDTIAKTVNHALTGDHEFLLAMKNNDMSIWYRSTHDREIKWVSAIENHQLSTSGVGTESFLQFGIDTAIATMKVHSLAFVENEDSLSDGFTNPDDLVSRLTGTGSKKQFLINGVEVTWGGSDGVVEDFWTIKSAYTFPKEDMLTDSPSDFVRTKNDGSQHVYVLDAGVNKVFNADQFNLIGINFRTGSFQMNASDSWGSPTVDQSFTVNSEVSGTVTGITENTVTDSSLSMRINQLARPNRPMYLRFTSGTANGLTYKIESNDATKIKITTATMTTDGAASSDTFVVFVDRISTQVTSASHRYVRLVIDAQQTADDFYKVGKFIFGLKLSMSKNFNSGFRFQIAPNINVNRSSRSGQRFTTKKGESRQSYRIEFTRKTSAFMKEMEEFMEAIDWSNNPFIFIPDSDNIQDFILGRLVNPYNKQNVITDIFSMSSLVVEEEL